MPVATLLEIVQRAAQEMNLSRPLSAAGSQEQDVKTLVALANRTGRELHSAGEWTFLQADYPVTVGAPVQTTGDTVSGSPNVSAIPSTAGIEALTFAALGEGIAPGTRVKQVLDGSNVVLTQPAIATATGANITFVRDTFAVPADFDRYINRTQWDRTQQWELIGPMSPQEAQWVQSGIVSTGPRRRWRQVGRGERVFRIWPPPSSADTPSQLVFSYISSDWVEAANGTFKNWMTLDDDVPGFDDDLMVMGVKWMYFRAKGFEYGAFEADWRNEINARLGFDGGAPTLNMARRRWPIFLSPANVQDGNWPGR